MNLSIDDTVKIKSSVTLKMLQRFGIEVDIRPYELTVYAILSKKYIKAYNEDVANGYDYTIPIDCVEKIEKL